MTAQQTTQLVVAAIALMSAIQGWLAYRSVDHTKQLNGMTESRTTAAAVAAVAEHHVRQLDLRTPDQSKAPVKGFTPSPRR